MFSLMSLVPSKGLTTAADMFTINEIKAKINKKCSCLEGETIKQNKILTFHFSLCLLFFILLSVWEFILRMRPQT